MLQTFMASRATKIVFWKKQSFPNSDSRVRVVSRDVSPASERLGANSKAEEFFLNPMGTV